VCGDEGIGGDDLLCAAFFAIDAHSFCRELGGVVAVVGGGEVEGVGGCGVLASLGVAFAVDLALGVEVVDDEGDDLHYLRVGKGGFVGVEVAEAFDAVFLKHIKQLELVACKLGFDVVLLAHKADVDARIGAGKHEDVLAVKEARIDVELVGLAAEDAGNADAYRAVRCESYVKRGIVARGSFVVLAFFD